MAERLVPSIGASVVRTVVPLIVGAVIAAAAKAQIELDGAVIESAVTLGVTTVYYAAVRFAETRLGPAWGWLLGYANAPQYEAPDR